MKSMFLCLSRHIFLVASDAISLQRTAQIRFHFFSLFFSNHPSFFSISSFPSFSLLHPPFTPPTFTSLLLRLHLNILYTTTLRDTLLNPPPMSSPKDYKQRPPSGDPSVVVSLTTSAQRNPRKREPSPPSSLTNLAFSPAYTLPE